MTGPVVDGSAILTFLLDEDGAEAVGHLDAFHVSALNWAEVLQFAPKKASPTVLLARFHGLGMTLHTFDETQAVLAARLHGGSVLRRLGFADRACLALATHLHVPAWTMDPSWTRADVDVEVRCLR